MLKLEKRKALNTVGNDNLPYHITGWVRGDMEIITDTQYYRISE